MTSVAVARAKAEASRPFVPWVIPAAAYLILGIAFAAWGFPWWTCSACLLLVPLLRLRRYRLIAILALLLPLGFARYNLWQAQPNPLQSMLGHEVTVSGFSDGRYLKLDKPRGASVVISPKGALGAGRVTLKGDLALPEGKVNPGGFDYRAYLRRRGVRGQLFVDKVVTFKPAIPSIKERLRRGVVAGLGDKAAGLMQAMVLGIRDDLGDLRDIFAASGMAHLLALSGLHVGVLIVLVGFLLTPLGLLRYPFLMLFIACFVLLVGASPSVVRAGAMGIAVLASLWFGGGRLEPWPAMAIAALVTLLWNPSLLADLSFQLSYLAVAGILLFTGPLMRWLFGESYRNFRSWHWRQWFVGSLVVSISAQALSLPLILSTFSRVSLLSPLVNIVAIPLASLLVPLGFIAGVIGLISLHLSTLLNMLTGVLASALIHLAQLASHWPHLGWGEISGLGYVYYAIAMLALTLALWRKLKLWRGLLVVCAVSTASMLSVPAHPPPEVVYIDVGQGDSSLIRLPDREEILVDGGGTPFSDYDIGANVVVPALGALGVDELELVIATHSDTDHIEGLVSVLKMMPVQELVIGVPTPGKPVFDALMAAAKAHHVKVVRVRRGEKLVLGEAELDFLNPQVEPLPEANENSVTFVLRLHGRAEALFQGDLPSTVANRLAFPHVKVLMAGHHGSRTSTPESEIRATSPREAVLSYGRNNYGHPSPEVLGRLRANHVEIHQTYLEGAVRAPLP
jgi:competence protein ComEC